MFVIADLVLIQLVDRVIDLHLRGEAAFVEVLFTEQGPRFRVEALNQKCGKRIEIRLDVIQVAVDQGSGVILRQDVSVDVCKQRVISVKLMIEQFRIFQHVNGLDIAPILHAYSIGQIFAVIPTMPGNDRKFHFVIISVIFK